MTDATGRLPCYELTGADIRQTSAAMSVKCVAGRLCIAVIWKGTHLCTQVNEHSPAARVASHLRLPRPSTLIKWSTRLSLQPTTCAQSAVSPSKRSSDFAPTNSDIPERNHTSVGAVVGLFRTEEVLQSMCGRYMQLMVGMHVHLAEKQPTVWTTCVSTCGPTEIRILQS